MSSKPQIRRRPSLRLKGYDYTQAGLYFVTIVSQGRLPLFGEVINRAMGLNRLGEIVQNTWLDLPRHYPFVELGAFVVMPNHVHGIIILADCGRGGSIQADDRVPEGERTGRDAVPDGSKTRPYWLSRSLSEIVRAFKAYSARRINMIRGMSGQPVWQRNYYDHIIRNQQDLELTWL